MSTKTKDDGLMTTMGKPKAKRPEKSKPDTERDSGFSDASSEYLSVVDQIDSEDAARRANKAGLGSRSQPSQLAVIGGSFQSLSSMIIMNNVLLKQPGDNPSSLKPWGFSPSVEVVQQPQVVFLQPVISQRTSKGPPSKRRKHRKYLPILKSYPKIAPHPGDSPRSSCASSTNSSTTASVKSCSSSPSSWDHPHGDKQQGLQTSTSSSLVTSTPNQLTPSRHLTASPRPHTPITDSDTGSCSGVEKPAAGSLELTTEPTDMDTRTLQTQPVVISNEDICQSSDSDSSKRKRFCNTYNILSKSGLLDITLRTKELIRQNRRTQAELDKLREHTALFMEALQTGDLHIWSKLQISMQEESEKEKAVNTGSETQNEKLI